MSLANSKNKVDHSLMTPVSHNSHLSLYPELEAKWGHILSMSPPQEQLFRLSGNQMITWKDDLDGKQAEETGTQTKN